MQGINSLDTDDVGGSPFNGQDVCTCILLHTHTHTHTHVYMYMYVYMYMCSHTHIHCIYYLVDTVCEAHNDTHVHEKSLT